MMCDSQRLRFLSGLLAVFAALALLPLHGAAQPELAVQLGFEGRLTPNHYAPIRIEVIDYRDSGASRFRITQLAGNAWRGEATLQHELGYNIQSSGRYEAVIPIYDPTNPITVELLSSSDEILARKDVDPRDLMRATPYPVLDMQLPRFDDRAAIITSSSLPTQWWGYDSAESLWIASSLPSEVWTAISQWVFAGGSLVVLTGTHFYRMDSPILRDLLPISNPQIAITDVGTSYLTGSHDNATIDLLSDEGFPLLFHKAYGSGQVSLITVQAQSLSVEDLRLIAGHVAPSQLISFEGITEALLGAQEIVTLDSLLVLGMIALLMVLVCVCAIIGRRNAKVGWAVLLASVCVLAVWSGFASNPTTHAVDQYVVTTNVYLQTSASLLSVSSCLYSRTTAPFNQPHREDILPLQYLPRILTGSNSVSSLTTPGETQQHIPTGGLRHWHAYGNAAALFDLELLVDSTVRVNNYHPTAFDTAWILIHGTVYPLGKVGRGNQEIGIDSDSSMTVGTFLSAGYTPNTTPVFRLLSEITDALSLSNGVWFIAAADKEQLMTEHISQKVRDITLAIARIEEQIDAN